MFAALVLSAVTAVAQQCEFVIPIPESLGTPGQVAYASGEGKLYCYLPTSGRLAVINPETRELTAFVSIGRSTARIEYNRPWHRLYCGGDSGFVIVNTVDDSVVGWHPDWTYSYATVDREQRRVYVSSNHACVRALDAITEEMIDSLALDSVADLCLDPLRVRLWCRTSDVTVIDCTDSLRSIGSVTALRYMTHNPWDGCVYGMSSTGIDRYDPVTLSRGMRWPLSDYSYNLTSNAPGDFLYYYMHYVEYGYFIKAIDMRTSLVIQGPILYAPGLLSFVPVGKRVWVSEAAQVTRYFGEALDHPAYCDSLRPYTANPAYDIATQRTYISDPARPRIVVFRDTLRDSSDVASAFVAGPPTLLDSGATGVFRSTCVNMGVFDKSIPLRLRVYARTDEGQKGACTFTDSAAVWIDGYGFGVAVFDTWRAGVGGEYVAEVTTEWPGDVNPTNDTARCTVRVLGPYRDVRPFRILTPPSTVDSGATIVPTAWILNSGGISVEFPVLLAIGSSYADTQTVVLGGGDSTLVSFAQWTASDVGLLIMRCSTMLANDSLAWNNRIGRTVRVLPPGAIVAEDSLPNVYSVGDWAPNPVSSVARLRYGLPQASPVTAVVYSVDGRQVKSVVSATQPAGYHSIAWDGRDDAGQSCGPGIYFCHVLAGPLRKSTKLTLTH